MSSRTEFAAKGACNQNCFESHTRKDCRGLASAPRLGRMVSFFYLPPNSNLLAWTLPPANACPHLLGKATLNLCLSNCGLITLPIVEKQRFAAGTLRLAKNVRNAFKDFRICAFFAFLALLLLKSCFSLPSRDALYQQRKKIHTNTERTMVR